LQIATLKILKIGLRIKYSRVPNILEIQYEKRLWEEEQFVKILNQFAITHKTKKILTKKQSKDSILIIVRLFFC